MNYWNLGCLDFWSFEYVYIMIFLCCAEYHLKLNRQQNEEPKSLTPNLRKPKKQVRKSSKATWTIFSILLLNTTTIVEMLNNLAFFILTCWRHDCKIFFFQSTFSKCRKNKNLSLDPERASGFMSLCILLRLLRIDLHGICQWYSNFWGCGTLSYE